MNHTIAYILIESFSAETRFARVTGKPEVCRLWSLAALSVEAPIALVLPLLLVRLCDADHFLANQLDVDFGPC